MTLDELKPERIVLARQSSRRPRVSAVIAYRPESYPMEAVRTLRAAEEVCEIVLVAGRSPSLQRNVGASLAEGELLYFLDDDSEVLPGSLTAALNRLHDAEADVVGGPAVTRLSARCVERAIGEAMGLRFCSGTTAARHRPLGNARPTCGEDLTLANLLVRRSVFVREGGFTEGLYPGEDPEFLKRVRRDGTLWYDPRMVVARSRRKSLAALATQFFRYGRGRARHIEREFRIQDLLFFAPSLLCLTLLAAGWDRPLAALFLGVIYLGLLAADSCVEYRSTAMQRRAVVVAAAAVIHMSYGVGFLWGLVIRAFLALSRDQRCPVVPALPVRSISQSLRDTQAEGICSVPDLCMCGTPGAGIGAQVEQLR